MRHGRWRRARCTGVKAINDIHGLGAGDHSLQGTSRLRADIRRCDVLGRIGGDDFCLLLTEASTLADAELWEGRLGEQVARHNDTSHQPYQLAITVGATVSTMTRLGRSRN